MPRTPARVTVEKERAVKARPPAWPRLMNVDEAGEYIGRSRNKVYELGRAGKIRLHKDGARTLVLRDDLDEWIDETFKPRAKAG